MFAKTLLLRPYQYEHVLKMKPFTHVQLWRCTNLFKSSVIILKTELHLQELFCENLPQITQTQSSPVQFNSCLSVNGEFLMKPRWDF